MNLPLSIPLSSLMPGELKERLNGLGPVMRLSCAEGKSKPLWRLRESSVTDVLRRPEKRPSAEPSREKENWKP